MHTFDQDTCQFQETVPSHLHTCQILTVVFYILLTVHLDVILVNDQLDALFLNVFISLM